MPWTSKRKRQAQYSRAARHVRVLLFFTKTHDVIAYLKRRNPYFNPAGFTARQRREEYEARARAKRMAHFPPTYGTTRKAVPHAVDVNGHLVPLDTKPIRIETTIGEQEENK